MSSRRPSVWTLRILALVLVSLGVSGTVRSALAQLSQHEWHLQPAWLLTSGVLYAAGLVPMAWFWHRALSAFGCPTPLLAAFRAYSLGHLGKYVPGKAMAVILRVAAVRRWVPSMRIALVSSLLETLTMMAAGAFLATVLSLTVLRQPPYVWLVAAAMACAAGGPTLPPIARWLGRLGVGLNRAGAGGSPPASVIDIESNLRGIDFRLLAAGWLAAGLCWVLLGLSLWAVLRGIGVNSLEPPGDLPVLITAVAFAVVAGFLSLLPGGLGVRDLLLMQLLVPACGDANALVAAVLMRLVWLVSELTVCGILYVAAGSGKRGTGSYDSRHGV